MTDSQARAALSQQQRVDAFLATKAEFDALLVDLQRLSNDHFGADPEAVLWGHVGTLEHWNSRLREVADSYFTRGEFAD